MQLNATYNFKKSVKNEHLRFFRVEISSICECEVYFFLKKYIIIIHDPFFSFNANFTIVLSPDGLGSLQTSLIRSTNLTHSLEASLAHSNMFLSSSGGSTSSVASSQEPTYVNL